MATMAGEPNVAEFRLTPAQAAGKEPLPAPKVEEEAEFADPTKDPAWAAFERAHADSVTPTSRGEQDDAALVASLSPEMAMLLGQKVSTAGPKESSPAASKTEDAKNTRSPEDIEKRTKALAALKRDGWKETMIQKLTDEELLEVGLQRHESQATIDSKLGERRQELREVKQAAPETKTLESGATPASGGPGQTASPTFDVAVKDAAADISRQFAEQFGEEVGKPVAVAMESGLRKLAAPILEQTQGLYRALQVVGDVIEDWVARDVRRDWKDEYPDTAAPETWAKIEKAYVDLATTGKYQGIEGMREAYEHARRIVMPGVQPRSVAQRSAAEAQENAQKAAGGLTIGARNAALDVKTDEAREFEAFLKAENLSESLRASMGVGAQ